MTTPLWVPLVIVLWVVASICLLLIALGAGLTIDRVREPAHAAQHD